MQPNFRPQVQAPSSEAGAEMRKPGPEIVTCDCCEEEIIKPLHWRYIRGNIDITILPGLDVCADCKIDIAKKFLMQMTAAKKAEPEKMELAFPSNLLTNELMRMHSVVAGAWDDGYASSERDGDPFEHKMNFMKRNGIQ